MRQDEINRKLRAAWSSIKQRCLNKNSKAFKYYGAKGVSIHAVWLNNFNSFKNHMGNPPSKNHSIDRINPFGNYEPGNVRWATAKQQGNNKRVPRYPKPITIRFIKGRLILIRAAAKKAGVSVQEYVRVSVDKRMGSS